MSKRVSLSHSLTRTRSIMTRPTRSSSSSSAAAAPAPASSADKFHVFDFSEEDVHVEKASERILGKFVNPKKSRDSPITKYKFLQAFAQGPESLDKDISNNLIDLDVEACEFTQESKSSLEGVSTKPSEVGDSGTDHQSTQVDACSIGVLLQDNCAKEEISSFDGFLESNYEFRNESHDVVFNDDNSSQTSSSSTSTSSSEEIEVSLEDQLMERGSGSFEINGMKMVVNAFPDFVLYGDIYSTSSRLIFSCNSVKLEGSTANGSGGTFKFEWPIDNIVKIESCWFGKVETAMVNLLLKSEDSREAGNTNHNPGFKELKFAVYDPCWSEAEEAVKSLDAKYTNIWNAIFYIDTDNNEDFSEFGQSNLVPQMHYFPIFDDTFDEVIYPKGDPDAVSISRRDIELLQPETFINDTIIDFYIKYLKNKIPPDEQKRFHFFNSFFFRKLADLDKDPSSACDGRAAFQRVRKWTRKVNIFEKDYIFIPINYSLHWSLIVICHPGEVACFQDEEIEKSSKVPCILHMDSLKGSHRGLKNVFQSYLYEEWRERHSDMVDDVSSKFLHLRFVSLELPQQENFYDCGLFLLHYVECFLDEAPINFSPFKITKFSDFLKSKWFTPVEASLKRAHIQKLIYDIFQDNSQKVFPTDCIVKNPPSDSFGRSCHPTIWNGDSFSSAKQGTDVQFPAASPIRVTSCFREPGTFFKDLHGTAVESSSANCQQVVACHKRSFMSPIEEIEEADEEIGVSSLAMEDTQIAVLPSDMPSTSYFNNDFRASETSLQGFSLNFTEAVEGHSFSRISTCNTLETGVQDGRPPKKIEGYGHSDKNDNLEYHSSTSSDELADCVVEDSQEANDMNEVDASVRAHPSLQGSVSQLTQNFDLSQSMNLDHDDSVSQKRPLASESDEQDAKRRRLVEAGGERRFTRSLLKENCLMSL